MANFVTHAGIVDLKAGGSPTRSGMPILEMQNLVIGNTVKITCNFFARADQSGRNNGFYYQIAAVNSDELVTLTPASGIFQSSNGWQSCTLIGLFQVQQVSNSPTEDIDFEVLFSKGDLSGEGQITNFTLLGEVVTIVND